MTKSIKFFDHFQPFSIDIDLFLIKFNQFLMEFEHLGLIWIQCNQNCRNNVKSDDKFGPKIR